MTIAECRALRPGDKVHAYNGPYVQNGIVIALHAVYPHARSGIWIEFEFINSKGKRVVSKKRHVSVDLGWSDVTDRRKK